jgi:hypothetical protein
VDSEELRKDKSGHKSQPKDATSSKAILISGLRVVIHIDLYLLRTHGQLPANRSQIFDGQLLVNHDSSGPPAGTNTSYVIAGCCAGLRARQN